MKKRCCLFCVLWVTLIPLCGQNISGTVFDDSLKTVSYSNVLLFDCKDTVFVAGTASDNNGAFSLPVDKGNYLLRVTSIGYDTLMTAVTSPTDSLSLRLKVNATSLKEVTVKGNKPLSYVEGNSLITNVANTTLSDLGNVEDVLNFIPMVWNTGSGYQVLGKGSPVFYINHRLVRDASELRTLSSQDIQRIEVVHHPGARYGKSVNAAIIIHTKKRTGDGFSLAFDNMIQVEKYLADEAQAEIYYRKNKFEVSSLVRVGMGKTKDFQKKDQTVFSDIVWNFLERKDGWDKYHDITARLRVNYDINAQHSLGAYYMLRTFQTSNHHLTDNQVRTNGEDYDIIKDSGDRKNRTKPYHILSSYYSGSIGKLKVTLNVDGLFFHSMSESCQEEKAMHSQNWHLFTDNSSDSHLWAERLSMTHPFLKGRISLGNESSLTLQKNDSHIQGTNVSDSKNRMDERSAAFFFEVTQRWKKFSCNVGLRFEHTFSKYEGQFSQRFVFNDLFPSATFSFSPANDVNLSLSYRGYRTHPTYRQMDGNVSYVNRFNISKGNPLLRPFSTKNASFNIWYKYVYLNFNYTHYRDLVTTILQPTDNDDAATLFTYDNSGKKDLLNISAGIQKQVSFLMLNYQASLSKQWYKSIFKGEQKSFNKPMFSLSLDNTANWKSWYFTVLFSYSSSGHSNNVYAYSRSQLHLGVNKSFLNKKVQVLLWLIDVFNGKRSHNITYSNNFVYDRDYKPTSRMATLTVYVKINNTKSKYKGSGAGRNEKNRL